MKNMSKICPLFACVYAMKNGCTIKGWMDNEGKLNGKKEYCNIYDVMCTLAKCMACRNKSIEDCKVIVNEIHPQRGIIYE
jgi:hypothetical protein